MTITLTRHFAERLLERFGIGMAPEVVARFIAAAEAALAEVGVEPGEVDSEFECRVGEVRFIAVYHVRSQQFVTCKPFDRRRGNHRYKKKIRPLMHPHYRRDPALDRVSHDNNQARIRHASRTRW